MAVASDISRTEALAGTYGAIAEWLLYPEEVDPGTLGEEAVGGALAAAGAVGPRAEQELRSFHERRGEVGAEDYLNLFELNPRCPLYLGSHQFEEPRNCNAVGLSDRNTYMLEIANVYGHFGFELQGELPDFLPAMVDFLALTADCEGHDAAVRLRFVDKLMLPGIAPLAAAMAKTESPYPHLVAALEACLEQEMPEIALPVLSGPAPTPAEEAAHRE